MTTKLKIGIGTTVGTGLIGSIIGINYSLSQPKNQRENKLSNTEKGQNIDNVIPSVTIRSKITNESGRKILDTNGKGWDIKLYVYNSLTDKADAKINSRLDLRNWCSNVLDSEFDNEQNKNYSQAKQVCTLPTSKEKLLKESKELATEDSDWQSRTTAYPKEAKGNLIIKEFNNRKDLTKEEIKDWCSKALEKEIENGKGNYALALKWCTKTGK